MENYNQLINAYIKEAEKLRKEELILEKVRIKFITDYSLENIKTMKLEDYAIGYKGDGSRDYNTFCYRIERELHDLGSILGSFASSKFGLYYNSEIHDYKFLNKFGDTVETAFNNIKKEIIDLIKAGKEEDFEAINKSKIAPMLRYKILSTYYPDKYFNISSEEHINEFLKMFNIKYSSHDTMLDKLYLLTKFKNSNPITASWSNYVYMMFLYFGVGLSSDQVIKAKKIQEELDKAYKIDYQYNLNITIDKWIEMLKNPNIFYEKDIKLVKQIYNYYNHATTCKELELVNGTSAQAYNKPVVELAKRILAYIGKEPDTRENGEKRYWNTLFWGQELSNGLFEWKLKPKLAKAIERIYPDVNSNLLNNNLDTELIEGIKNDPLPLKPAATYSDEIKERPEEVYVNGTKVFKRDRKTAQNALAIAHHLCEIDTEHKTFIRRADGLSYTEPHHLIPMAYQDKYSQSIDIEENIVSLCSNCHNEIHYGQNAKDLITILYNQRKDLLKNKCINISLKKLLSYYGIE